MQQAAKSPHKACIYLLYGQFTSHFHPGDDNIYELPMVSLDLVCVRLHKSADPLPPLSPASPAAASRFKWHPKLWMCGSHTISHSHGNLLACRWANEVLCAAWAEGMTLICPLIWVVNRFSIFGTFFIFSVRHPNSKLYWSWHSSESCTCSFVCLHGWVHDSGWTAVLNMSLTHVIS